jgi:hypothetical protein
MDGVRNAIIRMTAERHPSTSKAWESGNTMILSIRDTAITLQQPNGDVSLDLCNDPDVCLEIQLDVDLQTALDVVVLAESCIGVLILLVVAAAARRGVVCD